MKKFILLLMLSLPVFCFSQENIDGIPVVDGKVKFEKIITVENKMATELFQQTKLMISDLYKSGKAVTDVIDENALFIVVKGNSSYNIKDMLGTYTMTLEHTVKFQFKENRIRIQYYDLIVNTIPFENILYNNGKPKYSKKIRASHIDGVLESWSSYITKYQSLINKTDDNW